MTQAIFLDRDGVLNVDKEYAYKPTDLQLCPDVPAALTELKRRQYLLIVISNQSGVARGLFSVADVERFNAHLEAEIKKAGGPSFDGIYFCPHHPDGKVEAFTIACECRKPGTKLIDDAVKRFAIERQKSFLIGDKDSDIACATQAGILGIQINLGKTALNPQAFGVASSLKDALQFIPPNADLSSS